MRVLVVGNGGREHALLWKLRRDAPAAELFVTRGNGGTAGLASALPIGADEIPALLAWAETSAIDLVVVGPERPLALGLVDACAARGIPAFGPTAAAADIEVSKAFAKTLLRDAGVPTADFGVFDRYEDAARFIEERGAPIVVKASGLAAGKGAVVCDSVADALAAARSMLVEQAFGEAGREVVVEEFMTGEELSVFGLADGHDAVLMTPAQDHKRVGEGDTGPNTGGMGAYAPVSLVTDGLLTRVRDEIFRPTLAALRDSGRAFRGVLYAGLMLTEDGPRVVEYNARFGDPETQVVLPLLASSLLEPLLAIARGERLPADLRLETRPGAALTTVLAAPGYPGAYPTGAAISIPPQLAADDDVIVFHAGTRHDAGHLVTAGGRVLAVTAVAPTLARAAERSRAAADAIDFEGKLFRRDIGWRELARAGTA
jgi:phosphoribosylamine---glycine ligase